MKNIKIICHVSSRGNLFLGGAPSQERDMVLQEHLRLSRHNGWSLTIGWRNIWTEPMTLGECITKS